jgi:hypothetical protein
VQGCFAASSLQVNVLMSNLCVWWWGGGLGEQRCCTHRALKRNICGIYSIGHCCCCHSSYPRQQSTASPNCRPTTPPLPPLHKASPPPPHPLLPIPVAYTAPLPPCTRPPPPAIQNTHSTAHTCTCKRRQQRYSHSQCLQSCRHARAVTHTAPPSGVRPHPPPQAPTHARRRIPDWASGSGASLTHTAPPPHTPWTERHMPCPPFPPHPPPPSQTRTPHAPRPFPLPRHRTAKKNPHTYLQNVPMAVQPVSLLAALQGSPAGTQPLSLTQPLLRLAVDPQSAGLAL